MLDHISNTKKQLQLKVLCAVEYFGKLGIDWKCDKRSLECELDVQTYSHCNY